MMEVQIDCSRLPPVQEVCRDFSVLEDGALAYCLQEEEIEQHYASNVQKNQLVREDFRVAKQLQSVEEGGVRLHSPQEQRTDTEESHLAVAVQEDIRRKAEELRRRGEQRDQEIAKQLQDLEDEKSRRQKQRADGIEPLRWAMAGLELKSQEQLQQDEEFARRLQEEEEEKRTRLRTQRNREQKEDYRAAQVAQDEEIARYMQDQELKAQRRSLDSGESDGEEALQSHEHPSLIRVQPLQRTDVPTGGGGGHADTKLPFCRNVAEELDPTFRARSRQAPAAETTACSSAAGLGHPVPVDGFFDYMDEVAEPRFVSPTKRQPEKVGRQKSREKKDGCKQQ